MSAMLGVVAGAALLASGGFWAATPLAADLASSTPPPPSAPSAPSAAASPPTSPTPAVQVVGLGDSVMSGTNCGCDGIPDDFAHALSTRDSVPVRSTNLGVSGATTDDLLDDLTERSATRRAVRGADVVLVIVGANDLAPAWQRWQTAGCDSGCYGPVIAAMQKRLSAILAEIGRVEGGHPHAVIVSGYWNAFTDGTVALKQGGRRQLAWSRTITTDANEAIEAATDAARDSYVELAPLFSGDPDPLLADDGDHPNAKGVRAIARADLDALPRR